MTTVNAVPERSSYPSKRFFKTIAWVGLLVGTLDISSACTNAYISRGTSPVIVLQYIASAVFGKDAYTGGWLMAAIGLLFHYIIAYSFTIFFFWVYPSVKILSKNIALTAIGYAIFMHVVTAFLVLPLTKVPKIVFHLDRSAIAVAILSVAIGLPLAYFAKRFYKTSRS